MARLSVARKKLSLRDRLDMGNGFTPYLLVLPTILLILGVGGCALLYSFWLSLLSNPFDSDSVLVGWGNYAQLLASSGFRSSVSITLLFTLISVTLETILGMGIALLMNGTFPGRSLLRAAILVPWAFPTVVSAQIWYLMYNDRTGLISDILQQLHLLAPGSTVLQTNSGIIAAAIIADVWKNTPFMGLLLLAGLQVIPTEMYEAADVDGASRFQQFWNITLPMLNGPLTIALLFRTIASIGVFDLFYILGGNQVQSMSMYAYNYMFTRTTFDFDPGVAAAVVLFVVVVCQIAYRFSAMMATLKLLERRLNKTTKQKQEKTAPYDVT